MAGYSWKHACLYLRGDDYVSHVHVYVFVYVYVYVYVYLYVHVHVCEYVYKRMKVVVLGMKYSLKSGT